MNDHIPERLSPSHWSKLAQQLAELEMLRESGSPSGELSDTASLLDELEELSSLLHVSYEDEFGFVDEEQCRWVTGRVVEFPNDVASVSGANDDRVGECLGRYQLVAKLGSGGMGTVYSAIHTEIGRRFAVKTIAASRMCNPDSVARFIREMKLVGRLDHPHIVQAFDGGEIDGVQFFVMELVDGIDVSTLLKRCGKLPVSDACEIARQAAVGLQYIHEQGLVHRDLKPSNLMLTRDGQVKILDLGLALLSGDLKDDDELTRTGQMMGTLDYMAPEQSFEPSRVDIRADIYSLGVSLYKMVAGETPFARPGHGNLLHKVHAMLHAEVPSIIERVPELSPEFAAIVDRALARNPEVRHLTPLEFAEGLEPFCAGHQLTRIATLNRSAEGLLPPASLPSSTAARRRKFRRYTIGGACAIATILGGIYFASGRKEESAVISPADVSQGLPQAQEPGIANQVAESSRPELRDGYFVVPALPGDRAIEPRMIGDSPLTVLGTSFNSIDAAPRGFFWSPDSGSTAPWGAVDEEVTHCFGQSIDGQYFVLRSQRQNLLWDRDRGLVSLLPIRQFAPLIFCPINHTVIGAVRHGTEFHTLARMTIDPATYEADLVLLEDVAETGTIKVMLADEQGRTVIGRRSAITQGELGEYWIWREGEGVADLPVEFQRGGHVLDLSRNGRFLAGSSTTQNAIVHDLLTGTTATLSTTPHSLCSWVSNDGQLAAGYDLNGSGWIKFPEEEVPRPIKDLLQRHARISGKTDLSVPMKFSQEGRYLLGRNRWSPTAPMIGWVLETRLLREDFAERDFAQHQSINLPDP